MLNKIADLIESKLDEFAVAESRDQGKPVSLAKMVRKLHCASLYNLIFM